MTETTPPSSDEQPEQPGTTPDPAPASEQQAPPPPPPPAAPLYGEGAGSATPGGVRPAELMDRFLAKLIDGVIMFGVNMILVVFIVAGTIFSSGSNRFITGLVTSIVTTLIYLGYLAYMEHSQGRTVGKMVMKLRVVGPNGGNPTLEEAVKRNIWAAFGLAGIVPVVGSIAGSIAQLIAVIMIAVGISNDTVNRQAWHDQFAGGTRVIKEG